MDVSRVYFYARSIRPTFVKLPAQDPKSSDPSICGKLLFSMYGTRDAAQNWCNAYSSTLEKSGYKRGMANPCLFHNAVEGVSLMVHGDDFVGVGSAEGLRKSNSTLEKAIQGQDADDGSRRR